MTNPLEFNDVAARLRKLEVDVQPHALRGHGNDCDAQAAGDQPVAHRLT